MAKMDKKWAVLCSTAVAAMYAAGYFTTENQAAAIAQSKPSVTATAPATAPTSQHLRGHHDHWDNNQESNAQSNDTRSNNTQSNTTQSASKQTNSSGARASSPKSQYKDGKYQGLGYNRRGQIGVTVTIKSGKITDVAISDFEMHYSESDIVDLPNEVLKNQSSQVDNVSGATYSTQAFSDAVQDALLKAKNA